MILTIACISLLCAVIPAVMFCINLRIYRFPTTTPPEQPDGVSVLIPARNEAHGIGEAVRCALASTGVLCEIVVMDDGSTDGTPGVVQMLALEDARLRLEVAPGLPAGWNGKQHACWALAHAARYEVLCFVDADVRLEPECLARMLHFLNDGDNGLVSGFPRQVTGTILEWMLLPMIHFVLLGFLPLRSMRQGVLPQFAAGCGQFFMVRRDRYFACGGHSGIRLTMHDGIRLPRLFREHGFRTDLADITRLARCRMYTSAAEVWSGLAKNATEGLGAPSRIVPITLVLMFGQVLPFAFVTYALVSFSPRAGTLHVATAVSVLAVAAAWLPRLLGMVRFRQDWRGVLLHPFGVLLLLGVQWYALLRRVRGGTVHWKDRAYAGE